MLIMQFIFLQLARKKNENKKPIGMKDNDVITFFDRFFKNDKKKKITRNENWI